MKIYPAIDLYDGKAVRLTKGDFEQKTVYSDHPDEFAKEWEAGGAQWIHIVDLEGAKTGKPKNEKCLKVIRKATKCKLQFGGGIRELDDIERVLATGVDRVVLGTKALDENFFRSALDKFGAGVAVSLDTKFGQVQTEGWLSESGQTVLDVVRWLNETSVEILIYTDIQKDGMLQGPNMEGLREILKAARAKVILSGGICRLEDVKKCAELGDPNLEGVIIGKALYDGIFKLDEAIKLT